MNVFFTVKLSAPSGPWCHLITDEWLERDISVEIDLTIQRVDSDVSSNFASLSSELSSTNELSTTNGATAVSGRISWIGIIFGWITSGLATATAAFAGGLLEHEIEEYFELKA